MLHGRVVRPPAIGAKLESVDEGSIKGIRRIVKVVRQGNFLGVVAQQRMGRDQGARAASRRPGRSGKACPSRPSSRSMCAPPRSSRTRSPAMSATPRRRWARAAKKLNATYDFAIHTHGSIGPSCAVARIQGRQADLLVGLAGDPQPAQAAGADVLDAGRRRALHLSRRLGLLRPQRPRGRRRRCRAARQGGRHSRCACSGRAPTSMAGTRKARRR